MAQSTDQKTLSNGSGYWHYSYNCLGILKQLLCYVLILVCTIATSVLLKFSSLFECLSETLQMTNSAEDFKEKQIKHRSNEEVILENVTQSSNQEVILENVKRMNILNNSNEEVISEIVKQSSNEEVILEYVKQSSNEEFTLENLNQSSNQEGVLENMEQMSKSQTNEEVSEEKLENKTDTKVAKRCPVKRNAALYLFNKTIKEIETHNRKKIDLEEKSKIKELDTKMDKSYETFSNGIPCQENENSANMSDNLIKESQSTEHEPMNNDSSKLTNDSYDNAMLTRSTITVTNVIDQIEEIKPNNNYEKLDSDDYKTKPGCHNSQENTKTGGKCLVEKHLNAFSLPPEYSLALCVSEDLQFSAGPAVYFKAKFGGIGKLMDQNLHLGDVGEILHNGQYIFYLVVKEKYRMVPSRRLLEKALIKLCNKMKTLELTKLAIPKNGFDRYDPNNAMELISNIFARGNIQITICTVESKLDIPQSSPSKVNSTHKQLWEMESQTDIILFIEMEKMYLDNWNDKVVENINIKLPFKDKLLEDINIKPMAAGDVLSYRINNEELFCIFTKSIDQNPSYFECLEKAFQSLKSQMSGYRYIAIQRESIYDLNIKSGTSRHILLLQTVFSTFKAEIWICNNNDLCEAQQFEHYKSFVTNTMVERNKRYSWKSNSKQKSKTEKKKYKNANVTKMRGSGEPSKNYK